MGQNDYMTAWHTSQAQAIKIVTFTKNSNKQYSHISV